MGIGFGDAMIGAGGSEELVVFGRFSIEVVVSVFELDDDRSDGCT